MGVNEIIDDWKNSVFARRPPWEWDGLGVEVRGATSAEDALRKASLNWEVAVERVFVEHGGKALESRYMATVRTDTGAVLGIVSESYVPVQNREAFEWTNSLLEEGSIAFEYAGEIDGGRIVWLLGKLPEPKSILDSELENYLLFVNGHDGSCAVKVFVTPLRVVCANMLNLCFKRARLGIDRSWRVNHRGDLKQKLEEAKRSLHLAKKYLGELEGIAKRLVKRKLTDRDWQRLVETLIPLPKEASEQQRKNVRLMREDLEARINSPDLQEHKGTAWAAINAVADHLAHRPSFRNTQRTRERRFQQLVFGHPLLDMATELLLGRKY